MMDRLQKKCFIATASLHGLLVGVLLFGSALMPASREESNVKLFTAYDASKVSDLLSGSGEPDVQTPAAPAAPANPQPKPAEQTPPPAPKAPVEPPKVQKTAPPPEPAKVEPPKVEPPKVHPNVRSEIPDLKPEKAEKKPKLSAADLAIVKPTNTHKPTRKPHPLNPSDLRQTTSNSDESQQAAHDAAVAADKARRRRAEREVASTFRSLRSGLSTSTLVTMPPGVGTSGDSVNYSDLIYSKYYNAWIFPPGLDENTPAVTVTITITRDGNVKSARITGHSGNGLMDKSVQRVLELVTFIEPFPDSFTESERTVKLVFDPKAKRQTG